MVAIDCLIGSCALRGSRELIASTSFCSASSSSQFQGSCGSAHLLGRSRVTVVQSRGSSRRLRINCIGWDPENILAPPQPGHIARRSFEKKFGTEEERKAALEEAAKAERERRRAAREARVVPTSHAGLVDFFLETEGREMEYEIARCRPRLTEEFFDSLQGEIGLLRFGINAPKESEERLVELEELQKVLTKGSEAYDMLASRFTGAKDRLTKILSSKDKRATLLELAGVNELDRPLLALLDQNIAAATDAGQKEASEYMGKIRNAMLKYMTV